MGKDKNKNMNTRSNQIYNSLMVIGVLLLLNLVLFGAFGKSGEVVKKFLLGSFGFSIYAVGIAGLLAGLLMLFGAKSKVSGKIVFTYILVLILLNVMFHLATTRAYSSLSYADYCKYCYTSALSAGGVVSAWVLYPLVKIYPFAMVIIALVIVGLIAILIVGQANSELEFKFFQKGNKNKNKIRKNSGGDPMLAIEEDDEQKILYNGTINGKPLPVNFGKAKGANGLYTPIDKLDELCDKAPEVEEENYEFLVQPSDVDKELSKKRKEALDILYAKDDSYFSMASGEGMQIDVSKTVSELNINNNRNSAIKNNKVNNQENTEKSDGTAEGNKFDDPKYYHYFNDHRRKGVVRPTEEPSENISSENIIDDSYIDDMELAFNKQLQNNSLSIDDLLSDDNIQDDNLNSKDNNYSNCTSQSNNTAYNNLGNSDKSFNNNSIDNASNKSAIDDFENDDYVEDMTISSSQSHESFLDRLNEIARNNKEKAVKDLFSKTNSDDSNGNISKVNNNSNVNNSANNNNGMGVYDSHINQAFGVTPPKKKKRTKYITPDINCLKDYEENVVDSTNIDEKIEILERKMKENGIDITVVNIVRGPRFWRIEFSTNAPLAKVGAKEKDITMWLSLKSIRLILPIPGTPFCGVEIPNQKSGTVGLKAVINSPEFNNTKEGSLCFALGKDIDNKCYVPDICKFPHGLIAGSTGAGKSVGLNTMLCSMLYKYSPDQLRMILVDPKEVEFNIFSDIPHLLIPQIISDEKKTINALRWAVTEMDRRYTLLKNNQVTNIEQYNEEIADNVNVEKLPFILIVVDEVGDIILSSVGKIFDALIKKLAAKSRAAGIHLILATQRPTVDVITGTIKANLPTRIAFAVTSSIDSTSILDTMGAEKLLRNGDMLFKDTTDGVLYRVQGCFIHTSEVRAIVTQVKQNNECEYDPAIAEAIFMEESEPEVELDEDSKKHSQFPDELCPIVLDMCLSIKNVSISLLQRKFSLGFPRAGKIFDWLKDSNYIKADGKGYTFVLTPLQVEEIKSGDSQDEEQE